MFIHSEMNTIKKSLKSHNSLIQRISAVNDQSSSEQQPILSDHNRDSMNPEFIVKINDDNNNNNIPQQQQQPATPTKSSMKLGFQEDPPSKLIGQFLNKQKAAGGEMALDIDLEMAELSPGPSPLARENLTVSFQTRERNNNNHNHNHNRNDGSSSSSDSDDQSRNRSSVNIRKRSQLLNNNNNADIMPGNSSYVSGVIGGGGGNDDSQVLRCTSVQRRNVSTFSRLKTKSRFLDPPEMSDKRSGLLKQNRSGMTARLEEEEEDDPLFADDIPDEYYKRNKFDFWTFLEWISLISIVSALVWTTSIPGLKNTRIKGLKLWKWEVVILVVICGRLVAGWLINFAVFCIERNFYMRKRVLYFVYGVRKAVQNCIWLGFVLLVWRLTSKVEWRYSKYLQFVNKLLVCMLMGTLLWLLKTLMVKVLASSFHVSTFFDRIQESLFNQYVIETLSGPPLIEIQIHQEEEEQILAELESAGATLPPNLKSGNMTDGLPPKVPIKSVSFKFSGQQPQPQNPKYQEDNVGISIEQLHKLNHNNVSAWNMKRLIKVVKKGVLSTLNERVIDSASNQGDDEAGTSIKSEHEAISAARKIFRNVAKSKAKFIYIEDLLRFLREEEALKVLHIVEGSGESGKICKAHLKSWVVNSFRERKALALTLNDTKTAVKKLHQMVNVIVGVIIFVLCLVILGIATSRFLLFISSQIVVVAFIFGNTCKTIFEAVIFVFVVHPFDVGDRVEIDNNNIQLVVEEMNILTTVFLRYDNLKIVYPNAILATKSIANYYRSPDMGDAVDFDVHMATPAEKIALMRERIIRCIEDEMSDHWYPDPWVVLMNFTDVKVLKFAVWLRQRMNFQDMGERYKRRERLMEEMAKIFRELDIEYRLYPVDINIRAMPSPVSSRIPPAWSTPPGN